MRNIAGLILSGALLTAGGPAMAQRLLHAGPHWAALERKDGTCEAVSRSELRAPPGRTQARAAFAFSRDGRRRGELHLILSRPARPGSEALLSVAGQSFLLLTRGQSAWSRGAAQEQAILAAVRRAGEMRVRSQGIGGRSSDRYLLGGAPTAIDAAAVACAP